MFRRRKAKAQAPIRSPPTRRQRSSGSTLKSYICFAIQIMFFLVMAVSTIQIWNNDGQSAAEINLVNEMLKSDSSRRKEPEISDSSKGGTSASVRGNGIFDMKAKLTQRFNNLPLPPWPQLDHRTPQAILDGFMVGFDSQASPTPSTFHQSNTIVTAYYEFESKHGVKQYEKWFDRILRTSEPMIVFVEPGSRWFDFVLEHRKHAPTIVATLKFDDLVMSTTFQPIFWEFMHSIDLEASVHKGSGVYKIWNEKLVSKQD